MTTASQTRAIHALKRQIPQFSDEDYRALLKREFRVSSSRALSETQAGKLLDILKTLAGQNAKVRRAGVTAEGPYAGKLRALWISAYNLGLVKNRDDAALIAFVERQTKLTHTRFLVQAADASRAIEGLKAWIAREATMVWPTQAEADKRGADHDTLCKRAVIDAQTRLLGEIEAFDLAEFANGYIIANRIACSSLAGMTGRELDGLSNLLGKRLRLRREDKRRAA